MIYLSFDTETTGLSNECDLIELAMVLENTRCAHEVPVEKLNYFTMTCQPKRGHWEPFAMNMHLMSGFLAEVITAKPIEELEDAAMEWLWHLGITSKTKMVPAGKNFGSFDSRFLPKRILDCLSYRSLDPGSVLVDWTKDNLPSLTSLVPEQYRNTGHRALEDARNVIRALRPSYLKR